MAGSWRASVLGCEGTDCAGREKADCQCGAQGDLPQALPSRMRKIFQLHVEGKNRDRVLDAVKHEIRKYIKRERRRDLPEGADFWDFDCRFGRIKEAAEVAHLSALTGLINEVAAEGGEQFYVEIIAKPAKRTPRAPGEADTDTDADDMQDEDDEGEQGHKGG